MFRKSIVMLPRQCKKKSIKIIKKQLVSKQMVLSYSSRKHHSKDCFSTFNQKISLMIENIQTSNDKCKKMLNIISVSRLSLTDRQTLGNTIYIYFKSLRVSYKFHHFFYQQILIFSMTYQHSKTNIDSESQYSTQASYREIKLTEGKLRKSKAAKILSLIYSILMGVITTLISRQYFKNYKTIGSVAGLLVYISSKLSVKPQIQ